MSKFNDKLANTTKPLLSKPDFLVLNGFCLGGPIYTSNKFTTVKPVNFTYHQHEKTTLDLNISPLWKNTDGSATNAHLLIDGLEGIEPSPSNH